MIFVDVGLHLIPWNIVCVILGIFILNNMFFAVEIDLLVHLTRILTLTRDKEAYRIVGPGLGLSISIISILYLTVPSVNCLPLRR